jgi:hypothetical protein
MSDVRQLTLENCGWHSVEIEDFSKKTPICNLCPAMQARKSNGSSAFPQCSVAMLFLEMCKSDHSRQLEGSLLNVDCVHSTETSIAQPITVRKNLRHLTLPAGQTAMTGGVRRGRRQLRVSQCH